MKNLSKRIDEIDQELKNIAVTSDAFALWKSNLVTRKFLLEIEKDLVDSQSQTRLGRTIEEIAINEIKRSEHCDTLEAILYWNPIIDSE